MVRYRLSRRAAADVDEIAWLELEAKRVEMPSGDSGSNMRFVSALRAIRRDRGGEGLVAIELIETKTLRDADEALWMALPLLYELANSLDVEARFVNYFFRAETQ